MKFAILGAGNIANTMAKTVCGLKEAECYAVGSRSLDKAREFAKRYGFEKAYGSYEELLSDKAVELVYIATPHSHHYEHIKLCLEYGKNVLCEKAFTVNAEQAKEVLSLARQKGLLLTEAIWTRYMPMRATISELLASGVIGEVTSLTCNLGYAIDNIPRIQEPSLAGGALLDLSVYVLNFASMFFGDDIKSIFSSAEMSDKGVDLQDSFIVNYSDGRIATMYTTTKCNTDREGVFNGRNGFIKVENINNYEAVRVYDSERKLVKTIKSPAQITGYEYEVLSAINAIKRGELECPEMPHSQTIKVMELMDSIRADWGMKFPMEN